MDRLCEHLDTLDLEPMPTGGCEECLALGDQWIHLRYCATCGHIGCCDSSKNRHATRHWEATQHPVIRSREPGEHWAYCYVHEMVARTD